MRYPENVLDFAKNSRIDIDITKWITQGASKKSRFKLFDDVGQIYEIQLAKMEFSTLKHSLKDLIKRAAYFEEVNGCKTYHYWLSQVTGKGQIGHSNQYLTHWFYPYKGKFHGQMIKALINFMGIKEDGLILDPFAGSGTALIEAATLNIPSIGIEINPALCIVSRIKIDSLSLDYNNFHDFIKKASVEKIFKYFSDKFFSPQWKIDSTQLNTEATELLEKIWKTQLPPGKVYHTSSKWRNLLLLIFFHALSDYTYLKGTSKEMTLLEFFQKDLQEYLETLKKCYETFKKLALKIGPAKVLLGDALNIPLEDSSVDGIITSPPYSIALDYVKNDRHLLDYLSINADALREKMVGLKGSKNEKLRLYDEDMRKSIQEMKRVLKKGSYAAILLGDVVVAGKRTKFCQRILDYAEELNFSDAWMIKRPILGGYARLRYEYIILLRK